MNSNETRVSIGIDWSGAKGNGGQIFLARVCRSHDGLPVVTDVTRAANRIAVQDFLMGEELSVHQEWSEFQFPQLEETDQVVVGLDFGFGFPSEFRLTNKASDWTWDELVEWCSGLGEKESIDAYIARNADVAAQFRLPNVATPDDYRPLQRTCERRADGASPESLLNLVGGKQVGRGSVRGIKMLGHLRRDSDVSIWPFNDPSRVTVLEVFPRKFLKIKGSKEEAPTRIKQVEYWQSRGVRFEGSTEKLTIGGADALDAVASAIGLLDFTIPDANLLKSRHPEIAQEGWIIDSEIE